MIPIICICLTERKERLINHLDSFPELVDSYRLFDAFTPSPIMTDPRDCLTYSNLAILKMAKMSGWEELIILEDDVVLDPQFIEKFKKMRETLRMGWNTVHLGYGNMWESAPKSPYNDLLVYASPVNTHAMYYSKLGIEHILESIELTTTERNWDRLLIEFFKHYPGLAIYPHENRIARQLTEEGVLKSATQLNNTNP
jgi:hypothetical protein